MKPSDQPSYVDHVLMEVRHQLAALQQSIWADHHQDHGELHAAEMEIHSHEGHIHDVLVDGKKLEVDPVRFDKFVEGKKNLQVAVISVNGMVCDFCARGIERTFKKDE
ncbi:MAG: hypothetical protein EBW86_07620 [Rhodobacteraceae bacterium]|nr:hypothetical protein [Paracoccaceae bacterium]